MKISIANRKLIKMLFDLGTVDQIGGTYKKGFIEKFWEVHYKERSLMRDKERYDAYISGCYDRIVGDTLDEVLDALEAKMEELAA